MTNTANGHARSADLLPGFFLGGYECSTAVTRDGVRIDELALTGHDRHVRDDYHLLRTHGIIAARDGVRWNLVDCDGRLSFSSALPFVEAAEEQGITIIWDLFHYGYPDDLDPFSDRFIERFRKYCRAFARLLVRRGHGERGHGAVGARYYTPVNEISFYAWAGAQVGIFAPFLTGQAARFKRRLAEAAIAGINAIREVDPLARIVNCDPMVHVVAPADEPHLAEEAAYFNEHYVCEAWDILAGRLYPEIGGSPGHLDIVGVNYYGVNQWEHTRPDNVLAEDDPRRKPFSELLQTLHDRYNAPLIVTETTSLGDDRPRWLKTITSECLLAHRAGVGLHGVCIYPVIGMADWYDGSFRPMGLWDRCEVTGNPRLPHEPTIAQLKRLQRRISPSRVRMIGASRVAAGVAA